MKNHLFKSLLALLALCSAAAIHAENNPGVPLPQVGEIHLDQVAAVTPTNGNSVSVGTTRIMVSMRLGTPDFVLTDGSWLYAGYSATHDGHATSQPGTLVVRFAGGKVTRLTLASQTTVAALRATPRSKTNSQVLAAR